MAALPRYTHKNARSGGIAHQPPGVWPIERNAAHGPMIAAATKRFAPVFGRSKTARLLAGARGAPKAAFWAVASALPSAPSRSKAVADDSRVISVPALSSDQPAGVATGGALGAAGATPGDLDSRAAAAVSKAEVTVAGVATGGGGCDTAMYSGDCGPGASAFDTPADASNALRSLASSAARAARAAEIWSDDAAWSACVTRCFALVSAELVAPPMAFFNPFAIVAMMLKTMIATTKNAIGSSAARITGIMPSCISGYEAVGGFAGGVVDGGAPPDCWAMALRISVSLRTFCKR
jgi:hypothetical protein